MHHAPYLRVRASFFVGRHLTPTEFCLIENLTIGQVLNSWPERSPGKILLIFPRGPSPRPLLPWHSAHLRSYASCPALIIAESAASGLVITLYPGGIIHGSPFFCCAPASGDIININADSAVNKNIPFSLFIILANDSPSILT